MNKFHIKHTAASLINRFSKKEDPSSNFHRSLIFHNFTARNSSDIYTLNLDQFKEFLYCLQDTPIVPFSEDNAGIDLTFDDGYLSNFELIFPLLRERKIPYTVFMVTDFLSEKHPEYMNAHHLRELLNDPLCTIGAHGKTHIPLGELPPAQAFAELKTSKEQLEDILGQEVTTMSFPHGSFNQEILSYAQVLGYKKCGTSLPLPNLAIEKFQVNRQCIYSCDSLNSFKQKIRGQWDWLGQFDRQYKRQMEKHR